MNPLIAIAGDSVSNKTVYIVDADRTTRLSTGAFLRASGFETRPFISGFDFLAEPDLSPGCVLLDMDMSGLEVLRALAGRTSSFPVIGMTAGSDMGTVVQAMKLGASDFLEKSSGKALLLGSVTAALARIDAEMNDTLECERARRLVQRLTAREMDVLSGLLAGMTNKMMAWEYSISCRTLEMHRYSMMRRLGVKGLISVIQLGIAAGIAPRISMKGKLETDRHA